MTGCEDLGGDPPCWAHLLDDTPDEAPPARSMPVVIDLGLADTAGADGAAWSLSDGGDLDVDLVRLHPHGATAEHVNADVDVLLYVQSGAGELTIEGHCHPLRSDVLALIPRGTTWTVNPHQHGVTYLSIRRRRDAPSVATPARAPDGC